MEYNCQQIPQREINMNPIPGFDKLPWFFHEDDLIRRQFRVIGYLYDISVSMSSIRWENDDSII